MKLICYVSLVYVTHARKLTMKRKNFDMSTQHLLHPEEQHMVEAVV